MIKGQGFEQTHFVENDVKHMNSNGDISNRSGRDSGFGISKSSHKSSVGNSQIRDSQSLSVTERTRNNSQVAVLGKIFVGGLPQSCCTDDLRKYFVQFGTIIDCVVMFDKSRRHRGFGFATFANLEDKERVMALADRHYINQKWIEVKRCVPKEGAASNGSRDGEGADKTKAKKKKNAKETKGGNKKLNAADGSVQKDYSDEGMNESYTNEAVDNIMYQTKNRRDSDNTSNTRKTHETLRSQQSSRRYLRPAEQIDPRYTAMNRATATTWAHNDQDSFQQKNNNSNDQFNYNAHIYASAYAHAYAQQTAQQQNQSKWSEYSDDIHPTPFLRPEKTISTGYNGDRPVTGRSVHFDDFSHPSVGKASVHTGLGSLYNAQSVHSGNSFADKSTIMHRKIDIHHLVSQSSADTNFRPYSLETASIHGTPTSQSLRNFESFPFSRFKNPINNNNSILTDIQHIDDRRYNNKNSDYHLPLGSKSYIDEERDDNERVVNFDLGSLHSGAIPFMASRYNSVISENFMQPSNQGRHTNFGHEYPHDGVSRSYPLAGQYNQNQREMYNRTGSFSVSDFHPGSFQNNPEPDFQEQGEDNQNEYEADIVEKWSRRGERVGKGDRPKNNSNPQVSYETR